MERMMEIDQTAPGEKNEFLTLYALAKPAEQWRKFETYSKSYEEFKKEVIKNYPSSFPDNGIEIGAQDQLIKLIREMNSEVSRLLVVPPLVTPWEAIGFFLANAPEI
ncbi:hypothetical protein B0H10DRAFT_1955712 [Mycena sp. CBHHK59/15]|nr:hypothetical protein B0H10DRAFT_1955712 [Mycena sp. CBHHK59/15]